MPVRRRNGDSRDRIRASPVGTGVLIRLALAVLALASTPSTGRAQGACAGVRCSGHGTCVEEDGEAFCFCEEGYAAEEDRCSVAEPLVSRVRSSAVGGVVVHIATAEVGRDLATVGKGREARAPGRLSRYVRPGGLWCSDFVSWVYRAAGVPFTGGYAGGWMLPNNVAIRGWFQRRGLWVARGTPAYDRFTPRPGDYVRLRGRRWGHSAIVRYVDGDTLHLVEGNAGRRVRLTRYRDFRSRDRIDGFGILTQPAVRAARL